MAGGEVPPLFRDLVRGRARRAPAGAAAAATGEAGFSQRLTGLSPAKQQTLLLELIARHVAILLGHGTADAVDAERGFLDLGMSSLTAVELRNRLHADTGLRLPTTLIFDHPTPVGLAGHLRSQLVPADGATAPVFAELDLLEAALSGSELDRGARSRLVKRLQEMQWKLDAETGASTGPEADDLTASTDDEMFDLIDKELGLS
jgi:hypothetical protein